METQFKNLVNNQVDPNIAYYSSPLTKSKGFTQIMMYAATGDHKSIKHHLDSLRSINEFQLIKLVVNQKNELEWTPLMIACRNSATYSNIETVKILLENGADIDSQNNSKFTALIFACGHVDGDSNIETVELLLENKANVNLVDVYGDTALMFICGMITLHDNHLDIIQLLIKYGANVNIVNNDGKNAFMKAYDSSSIEQHNKQTLKLLLKSKTDLKTILSKSITVQHIIDILL